MGGGVVGGGWWRGGSAGERADLPLNISRETDKGPRELCPSVRADRKGYTWKIKCAVVSNVRAGICGVDQMCEELNEASRNGPCGKCGYEGPENLRRRFDPVLNFAAGVQHVQMRSKGAS